MSMKLHKVLTIAGTAYPLPGPDEGFLHAENRQTD